MHASERAFQGSSRLRKDKSPASESHARFIGVKGPELLNKARTSHSFLKTMLMLMIVAW
jgi:hypothetical protein